MHWMLFRWRELTKYNSTECTTTISTTLVMSATRQEQQLPAPLSLQTWKEFEIDHS